ncbi:hypothetical protein JTB14_015687 [Gonioctena quinquepunctata]|nr:hypothetical protein JTB14_015687 [Gonioctena quinquepunctata]
MKYNNSVQITQYDVAALFNKAYCKVISLEKGISGFKSTGIFSCQPDISTDEDFAFDPIAVTCVDSEQMSINNGQIPPEANKENDATKNGISTESEHQKLHKLNFPRITLLAQFRVVRNGGMIL